MMPMWFLITCFTRSIGSYILGKSVEIKGFLKAQQTLILAYLFSAFLFFLLFVCPIDMYQNRVLVFLIAILNTSLIPATLMVPAVYLMMVHDSSSYVKISALVCFSFFLGRRLVKVVFAAYDPLTTVILVLICNIVCGLIFYTNKKNIENLKKETNKKILGPTLSLPGYQAKILAVLIGGIFCAARSYQKLFFSPYLSNVMIIEFNANKLSVFLNLTLIFSLYIFSKICDYIDFSKVMLGSLIGVLFTFFCLTIFGISGSYESLIYLFFLTFFAGGFFATSLALIFLLFKNNRPFFNSILWFSIGTCMSNVGGHFLSNEFGPFQHYLVVASPFVLIAIAYLAFWVAVKKSPPMLLRLRSNGCYNFEEAYNTDRA